MAVSGRYSPPCSSRIADGVIKGVFVGIAWTVAVDVPSSLSNTSERKRLHLTKCALRNSGSFSLFLAIYSGMQCCSETLRDKKDWKNHFVGGFSAGLCSGLQVRSLPHVLGTALAVGCIASVAQLNQGGV